MMPVLTVAPLRTEALRQLKRTAAQGVMLLQLGAGILSGGRVNSWGVYFPAGQVVQGAKRDDEGHARYELQIAAKDAGATAPPIRIVRF